MVETVEEYSISKDELMKLGSDFERVKRHRNAFIVLFFVQTVFILFLLGVI